MRRVQGKSSERQAYQYVDEQGIGQVNEQIDEVVADYIGTSQAIVEGERQITDETPWISIVPPAAGNEVSDIFHEGVFEDRRHPVPLDRAVEGIGVRKKAHSQDDQQVYGGPFEKISFFIRLRCR